ncbi:MAG: DUF2480 family protein [Flavisolibacter sp.]
MDELLVNKVARSGILTLDLETYRPKEEIVVFDLADYLYRGLILKEKEFRETLKKIDWSQYKAKNVALICSVDAVIPVWAYMLVAVYVEPFASQVYPGGKEEMFKHLFLKNLDQLILEDYKDQRVVIKGCGENNIENFAYTQITARLRPVVKSIMFGEPCSTVPIFKKTI